MSTTTFAPLADKLARQPAVQALPHRLHGHLCRACHLLQAPGIQVVQAEQVRDGLRLEIGRGQGATAEYGTLVVYHGMGQQWNTVVAQGEWTALVEEALGHLNRRPTERPARRPWHPAQARAMRARSRPIERCLGAGVCKPHQPERI